MSRTAWQDRHAVPVHHHLHSNIRPTHHRHFHHKGPRELPVVTGRQTPNKRYELGADGLPTKWIARAIRSATTVPAIFNTDRMVGEYFKTGYLPAFGGVQD